jgi:hypothetical protein
MLIVSANYLDRESPERWLVRDSSQPEAAVAHRGVIAHGVAFCPASDYEAGFGCNVVAHCENAIGGSEDVAIPEGATPLKLVKKIGLFFNEDYSLVVETCDILNLRSDGSTYAVADETRRPTGWVEKDVARLDVSA